jgi:hypothetical protein
MKYWCHICEETFGDDHEHFEPKCVRDPAPVTNPLDLLVSRQDGSSGVDTKKCVWKEDSDIGWHTDCGEIYCIIDGTPEENKMKFCPFCGAELIQETEKFEREWMAT